MGCIHSNETTKISFSDSYSESELEPIETMKLYERSNEKKEIIYTEQMIRDIFISEYKKQNSILKNI